MDSLDHKVDADGEDLLEDGRIHHGENAGEMVEDFLFFLSADGLNGGRTDGRLARGRVDVDGVDVEGLKGVFDETDEHADFLRLELLQLERLVGLGGVSGTWEESKKKREEVYRCVFGRIYSYVVCGHHSTSSICIKSRAFNTKTNLFPIRL